MAELDNTARTTFTVQLPTEFKSGGYRIGIRIEDPWSPPSPRPRKAEKTAFDLNIELGQPLDLDDPIDRLINSVKIGNSFPQEEDVQSNGHVIISLLDQLYRDEGVQGLMGHHAALAYNALSRDGAGIVRHIVRALEMNLLDRDSRVAIALALMPTVFKSSYGARFHGSPPSLNHGTTSQMPNNFGVAIWVGLSQAPTRTKHWTLKKMNRLIRQLNRNHQLYARS
jgi:hypothetical protein